MGHQDDEDDRAKDLQEQEILEGLMRAQRDWIKVVGIIADAATVGDAERRLVQEMHFSEAQSAAVLLMPFTQLGRRYRMEYRADLRDLRRTLRKQREGSN
jgi:DNA gyrase/topoisomerase IV subunit A